MSPTLKRVLSVTTIILCGLVILLSAAFVIGAWATTGKIIDAGTKLITAAEKAAVAVQIGLESIDNGLGRLEEDTQTIEDATAQLSQNISDKGLILVLLPPAKEVELIHTISAIDDALATVEQMFSSLIDTLSFIESLPCVELPKPDPETVSSISEKVEKLNASINNVNARIQEARDNSAGAAQKISDAVGELNTGIEDARAELETRSEQLAATQDSLASIKDSFPTWVYIGAFLITLILGWVIYTQVLIIQFSLAKYKSA
jgi:predicted  nucleic acid-binding Zn-ribbon protein